MDNFFTTNQNEHNESQITQKTKPTTKRENLEVENLEADEEVQDKSVEESQESEEEDEEGEVEAEAKGDEKKPSNRKGSVALNQFSMQGLSLMKIKEAMMKQQQLANVMQREQFNFFINGKKLKFADNSLFVFDKTSRFRRFTLSITESRWFDRIITVVILVNTFLLMFTDYSFRLDNSTNTDTMSQIQKYAEYAFAAIFILEFLLKVIGMGFILEKHTYMRSGWNVIDFGVVISSILSLAGGKNFSAARAIRILRPLRSINAIKGMKLLVSSLLDALPDLGNVVVFLFYLIVLFGILGIQLFIGNIENRCRFDDKPSGDIWPADTSYQMLCVEYDDSTCPADRFCRNPARNGVPKQAGEDFIPELNFGYSNFDNIFWSTFAIYQVLTTEGWSTLVYIFSHSTNPVIVYIYFDLLILIGAFFAVNLILAVINESFLNANEQRQKEVIEEEKMMREEKRRLKEKQKANRKNQENAKVVPVNDSAPDQEESNNTQMKTNLPAKPNNTLAVLPPEDDTDSDDSAKRRENELFKLALRPVYYIGRAQILKKLEEQHNRGAKNKMNFFDPTLTTMNNNTNHRNEGKSRTQYMLEHINKVRKWMVDEIIEGKCFNLIVTIFIISNTVVLSLDRYPQPQKEIDDLQTANLVFTLFFLMEMIVKLIGYGFEQYFRDSMNVFDSFIVVISLTEQILDSQNQSVSGGMFTAIAAFRTLRLFRIFKLARSWVSFRQLLLAIISTLGQISYFIVLVFLFMLVSALLGMELFAYYVRFEVDGRVAADKVKGNSPLLNFDTFYNSMIFVFALLTGENWNNSAYLYMTGMESWWPALYFSLVVLFGNFILLKLFLAILLYNFGQSAIEAKRKIEESQKRAGFAQILEGLKATIDQQHQDVKEEEKKADDGKKKKKVRKPVEEYLGANQNSDAACFFQGKYDNERFDQRKERKQKKIVRRFFDAAEVEDDDDISDDSAESAEERQKQQMQQQDALRLKAKLEQMNQQGRGSRKSIFDSELRVSRLLDINVIETSGALEGSSLYLFGPKNKMRKIIVKLINHRVFEGFIILMILVSSILLALDDPLVNDQNDTLYLVDILITLIFMLEATLKVIAHGLIINGENSYLRQLGNVLDFIVIIFSAFSFDQSKQSNFNKIKIIRVLRVLRPLRLISRNEGLKVAINALIMAIPQIVNLVFVCAIFFLLFGIFGVNSLKGSFFYCDTVHVPAKLQDLIFTDRDCFDYGGDWINEDFNFDNILNAMTSLFIIATTEGWIEMMFMGVDARGIDLQPKTNSRIYWQLFYVGFIVVGAFFVMNLFVGVVVDSFNTEKDKLRGYFYLTLEQQDWVDIQYRILNSSPNLRLQISKENLIRRACFRVTQHRYFETCILFMIVLNTLLFMLQFIRQPEIMTTLIYYGNICFLAIFALEAIAKIIAQGQMYFREGLNVFDLGVVLLTLIGFLLEMANLFSAFGTGTSVLRTFRIIRVLKLIKSYKKLQVMFQTFIETLPALANIGGLLTIVLFIYAVLGMNLYPFIRRGKDGISTESNFSSFWSSFFTLFKTSTGEQWNLVLGDCTRSRQSNYVCYTVSTYEQYVEYGLNGCGDFTGYLFYISFEILFSTIMLNLFIAVILEGFDQTIKAENSRVKPSDIELFQEVWKQFDKTASGFIPASQFTQMMLILPAPLGWKSSLIEPQEQRRLHQEFAIPAYILKKNKQGMYFYYDVLKAISHKYMVTKIGDLIPLEPEKPVKANSDLIKIRQKKLDNIVGVSFSKFTSSDIVACLVLKKRLQFMVQRRKARELEDEQRRLQEEQDREEDDESEEERPAQLNNEMDMLIGMQTPNNNNRGPTSSRFVPTNRKIEAAQSGSEESN